MIEEGILIKGNAFIPAIFNPHARGGKLGLGGGGLDVTFTNYDSHSHKIVCPSAMIEPVVVKPGKMATVTLPNQNAGSRYVMRTGLVYL